MYVCVYVCVCVCVRACEHVCLFEFVGVRCCAVGLSVHAAMYLICECIRSETVLHGGTSHISTHFTVWD